MGKHPRVQISGPLSGYISRIYRDMRSEGYAVLSAVHSLHMVADLSRWLEQKGLSAEALRADLLDEFFVHRRRAGYTNFISIKAAEPLLRSLARCGVQFGEPPPTEGPHEPVLAEFARYLETERGLTHCSVKAYGKVAQRFLEQRFGKEAPSPISLTAADVTGFVVHASRHMKVGSCKYQVTVLRALLRWLHLRGDLSADLSGCVPAVAGWRQVSLPLGLESDEVERLLRCCDRRKSVGRRNYAVLLLLVRMGLRAAEVAAIELDDVDWRVGELTIHGKGCKLCRLPLPHEVGEALAAYLERGRPRRPCRKLFLSSRAPYGGIGSGSVSTIAQHALKAAGVHCPGRGSHALRHTAATQMLRRGGSLSEIAQVLRHSHIDTTAIYAKVDLDALRELTQPWPGGGA